MTRFSSHRVFRRLGDCKGTNLIEAAIITPLLLLLTFSIVDFGSLFYVYLALENGVSQATRYGVTGNLMDDPSKPCCVKLSRDESIKLAMRQATPTLTIADTAFVFTNCATPCGGAWAGGSGGPGDMAKLQINYTWTLLTPLMRAFFPGGQITLSVDSVQKNESRFQ